MAIQVELGKGDPERVAPLIREALAADPDNTQLRNQLGYHLQRQEQFEEADAEFEALQNSDDPQQVRAALYQRARTRILGEYEQDKAVRFLQEYVEGLPEDDKSVPSASNAYWRMGNAHEQLKQLAEARAAYTQALKLNPENDEAKKSLKGLPR
jgi:tetratricopeptide (TPR) repeat protein